MRFYVYILYRDDEMTDPFYVGKGTGKRANMHGTYSEFNNGGNVRKHNAVKKRLRELGHIPKAIFADSLTEDEAFAVEEWLIDWCGRIDLRTGCLTNATNGGQGQSGYIHSEETKKKISESHMGKYLSDETKRKISASQKGKIVSLKTRQKMSEWQQNGGHPMFGRKHADSSKQKMSVSRIGKKWSMSQEGRENIRQSRIGKKASQATREKMSAMRQGEQHPNYGKPMSEEQKKKISETRKARFISGQLIHWTKSNAVHCG